MMGLRLVRMKQDTEKDVKEGAGCGFFFVKVFFDFEAEFVGFKLYCITA